MRDVLSSLRRDAPYNVEEFMFPEDHPEVDRCKLERNAVGHKPGKTNKWEVLHLQAYQEIGLAFPPVITDVRVPFASFTADPPTPVFVVPARSTLSNVPLAVACPPLWV
jgi:hypothetical protein